MSNTETERTATIQLFDRPYNVTYQIQGTCSYDPGNVGGLPENCYPPESSSEVEDVLILTVFDDETGGEVLDSELNSRLLTQLNKLPLDDYLYESWSRSGNFDDYDECD